MTNPEQCWYLERIGQVDEVNYVLNSTKDLIRFGRSPRWNDKVCKCRVVSQRHLELVRKGSIQKDWRKIRWIAKNLSKTNGTYVNNVKIGSSQLLENNDVLGLGKSGLESTKDGSTPPSYTFVYRVKAPSALTDQRGKFQRIVDLNANQEYDVSNRDLSDNYSDDSSNNNGEATAEDDDVSDLGGEDIANFDETVEGEESETEISRDKITSLQLTDTHKKLKENTDKKLVTRMFAKDPVRHTFLWEKNRQEGTRILLEQQDFAAAPVSTFLHAPLADSCENSLVGVRVGLANSQHGHKIRKATIIRIEGYMALLKYEKNCGKIWLNILSRRIQYPCTDLEKCELEKTHMLRPKVQRKTKYEVGSKVEVLDRSKLGRMKVATIAKITGNRLHLLYDDPEDKSNQFWCNENSSFLHEVGWSRAVGHKIYASQEYLEDTASHSIRQREKLKPTEGWEKGMRLEVVDPIIPKNICPATVKRVLRGGYIYVRIDSSEKTPSEDCWFCYPTNSQHIFPPEFCEKNNITLTIDNLDYDDEFPFKWSEYLKTSKAKPAPEELFSHREQNSMHAFKVGMKVECADLIDPNFVCPATIIQVAGRLLKIHFDGWPMEYNQWMDCRSEDLYPVGWSQVVGNQLQAPYGWMEASEQLLPKLVPRTSIPPLVPKTSLAISPSLKHRKYAKKRKKVIKEGYITKSARS